MGLLDNIPGGNIIGGAGKIIKDNAGKVTDAMSSDANTVQKGMEHLGKLFQDKDAQNHLKAMGAELPKTGEVFEPKKIISQIGEIGGKAAKKAIFDVNDIKTAEREEIRAQMEAYVKSNESGTGATELRAHVEQLPPAVDTPDFG